MGKGLEDFDGVLPKGDLLFERFQVDPLRLSGPPKGPELSNPLKMPLRYDPPKSS